MKAYLVSFIVPVYNAARTLDTCIQSIMRQTYSHFEIILINDGSTDQSGALCDQYTASDSRIRTFHQANKGAASARNKGIHHALGTYIQFVDADDFIAPEMTRMLVGEMNDDVDLAICGYATHVLQKGKQRTADHIPSIQGTFSHRTYIESIGLLYAETIFPSPCNKLYKADVILAESVRFMDAFHMGEDVLFNIDYIEVCNYVSVVPRALYTYVIRDQESLSTRFHEKYMHYQLHIHQHITEFLQRKGKLHGPNKTFIQMTFMKSIINSFTHLFHPSNTENKREKKARIQAIVDDPNVQNHTSYLRGSLQARIVRILIANKSIRGIYAFFSSKQKLQTHVHPLYTALKKIDTIPQKR